MRHVVVGAGLVGLSVAWFLQEHGEQVTVVDRSGVAAGASWGNAGWLSPGLATPLPEPAVLRYGLKALLDPDAALSVPARLDPSLWTFLLRFARNCTPARWDRAMNALAEVNGASPGAYDELSRAGVNSPVTEAPIMAAFTSQPAARPLLHELDAVGTPHLVHNDASHPSLTTRVGCVVEITGQRYIDPGAYTGALAEAVTARGGIIRSGFTVARLLFRRGDHRAGYDPGVLPGAAGGLHAVFRGPDEPPAAARFRAIVGSVQDLLSGVDWGSAIRHWVGPRPVTADGLPLIGATSDPRVFVAGGHGMWGITLGPVTGMLLAERIVTGKDPKAIRPFNPLR